MTPFIINPSRFEGGGCCPCYTDDFSATGCWLFHACNSKVTISGGTLNATLKRETCLHGAALDLTGCMVLGGDLCNTKWEIRVKMNITTLQGANNNENVPVVFGVTDSDESARMSDATTDGINTVITSSLQSVCERRHKLPAPNCGTHLANCVTDQTDPVTGVYFFTLRRESATTAKWQLDSCAYGCGGFLCIAHCCVSSSTIGLDHINMFNYSISSTFCNSITYTLDCLEIYDGINL